MNEKRLTIKQIKKAGYEYHHTACRKGYTRVKERGYGERYSGRFGTGYIVPLGRHKLSTVYEDIAYYIKPENNN